MLTPSPHREIRGFKLEKLPDGTAGYIPVDKRDQDLLACMKNARIGGKLTLPSGSELPTAETIAGHGHFWLIKDGKMAVAVKK